MMFTRHYWPVRAILATTLLVACGRSQASPPSNVAATAPAAASTAMPSRPGAPAATGAPTDAPATAATPRAEVRRARTTPRAMTATPLQVAPTVRRGALAQDHQMQLPEGFGI